MEGQKPVYPALEAKRRELADYVSSQGTGFAENLDYVVEFLRENPGGYMKILKHAEKLKISQEQDYDGNALDITSRLSEEELSVVKEYMEVLAQYAKGKADFHSVKINARKLIRLRPLPDTIYAPPDSEFYKNKGVRGETLVDAMEIV